MLTSYFTRPRAISLPQTVSKLFKYNIGENVRIDLNKSQRQFPFKYSLSGGKSLKMSIIKVGTNKSPMVKAVIF